LNNLVHISEKDGNRIAAEASSGEGGAPVEKHGLLEGTSQAGLLVTKTTAMNTMLSRTIDSWTPIQVPLLQFITALHFTLRYETPGNAKAEAQEAHCHEEEQHETEDKVKLAGHGDFEMPGNRLGRWNTTI